MKPKPNERKITSFFLKKGPSINALLELPAEREQPAKSRKKVTNGESKGCYTEIHYGF